MVRKLLRVRWGSPSGSGGRSRDLRPRTQLGPSSGLDALPVLVAWVGWRYSRADGRHQDKPAGSRTCAGTALGRRPWYRTGWAGRPRHLATPRGGRHVCGRSALLQGPGEQRASSRNRRLRVGAPCSVCRMSWQTHPWGRDAEAVQLEADHPHSFLRVTWPLSPAAAAAGAVSGGSGAAGVPLVPSSAGCSAAPRSQPAGRSRASGPRRGGQHRPLCPGSRPQEISRERVAPTGVGGARRSPRGCAAGLWAPSRRRCPPRPPPGSGRAGGSRLASSCPRRGLSTARTWLTRASGVSRPLRGSRVAVLGPSGRPSAPLTAGLEQEVSPVRDCAVVQPEPRRPPWREEPLDCAGPGSGLGPGGLGGARGARFSCWARVSSICLCSWAGDCPAFAGLGGRSF